MKINTEFSTIYISSEIDKILTEIFKELESQKVFILVGGLGTRLRSVIKDVPKPMAPVEGKPFLYYRLMQLKRVGLHRIVFCSGYLSEIIEEYFGDGSKFDMEIEYSIEEQPLGTAGAIKNAEKYVDGPFFMMNGDTYMIFQPKPMLDFINQKNGKYCILLTTPHVEGQEGLISVDENHRIVSFVEKPEKPEKPERYEKPEISAPFSLINAGIYYLSPDILDYIPLNKKISIERDVFPEMLQRDEKIYGFEYHDYFIDIGIPENYNRFCNDVENHKIR